MLGSLRNLAPDLGVLDGRVNKSGHRPSQKPRRHQIKGIPLPIRMHAPQSGENITEELKAEELNRGDGANHGVEGRGALVEPHDADFLIDVVDGGKLGMNLILNFHIVERLSSRYIGKCRNVSRNKVGHPVGPATCVALFHLPSVPNYNKLIRS